MPRVLLTCLVLASLAARAGALDDARKLVDDLDFAGAVKLLDQLEKAEGNDTETLRELWLLQGVSYGTLGKDAKARDAFRKLLIVFPDAKLPPDLPPRVRTPFFEAKDWASTSGALTAMPSAVIEGGQVKALEILLGPDVLRLARTVRFHQGARVDDVPLNGGAARLATSGTSVEWWVELLSERKGVLLRTEKRTDGGTPVAAKLEPAGGQVTEGVVSAPTVEGAWRRPTGLVLLGAGAVAAGIGVAFGVSSSATRARFTGAPRDEAGRIVGLTQREAAALEPQATSQAIVANVLFGVGAGLGAVGLVLTILGPSGQPVAVVVPAGAGLSVNGSF